MMRFKEILLLAFSLCVIFKLHSQNQHSLEYVKKDLHKDIRLEYQVLRENQIRHGKYTLYYRGNKLVDGKYVAGKKHGKWTRYYLNGNPMLKGFYLQGKKHGNWEAFYPNKLIMAKCSFQRGLRMGRWVSYYTNGWKYGEFSYENDTTVGVQRLYYAAEDLEPGAANNQLKWEGMVRFQDGSQYIDYQRFYPNGKIFQKCTEMGDEYVGLFEEYYPTGLLWKKARYEPDGRLFSIFDWNNPVGGDAFKGTFRDGNGELFFYNSNGDKFSRMEYHNGFPDGKMEVYENDEKILVTGYFDDNVPEGGWKVYKPIIAKKEIIAEYHFTGKDTLHTVLYQSDGQARFEGEYVNFKKMDVWRRFSNIGELREETEYQFGFRHGSSREYRPGDVLAAKGFYSFGNKVGKWVYYNDFGKVALTENFPESFKLNLNYLKSDSCRTMQFLETRFYATPTYLNRDEKRLAFLTIDDLTMSYDHTFNEGFYSSWPDPWNKLDYEVEDYEEKLKPQFPRIIPWDIEFRNNVVSDYDIGLLIEALNPRILKTKKIKTSKKLGVAIVNLQVDEFGFIESVDIVRGVHPKWDKKLTQLIEQIEFLEPASLANIPMACSFQFKVPIELELVKRMN